MLTKSIGAMLRYAADHLITNVKLLFQMKQAIIEI